MTRKTTLRDLTKLSTRQLRDEAEALHTADIVYGAALAPIEGELRRRKAAHAKRARQCRRGDHLKAKRRPGGAALHFIAASKLP